MNLFADKERTAKMPAPQSIGMFEWLDICGEPYCQEVRDQLERMLSNYPNEEKAGLLRRIASDISPDHRSGLTELVVHEWLLSAKCSSVEVEPALKGQGGHPDFLSITPDGFSFYTEVASRGDDKDFKDSLIDEINKVVSPYYLEIRLRGKPSAIPSISRICGDVQAWVKNIQPDEPDVRYFYDKDGLTFELTLIGPKKVLSSRTIGAQWSGEAEWVSVTGDIEKSLKKKASKYGDLGAPYVVVVSSDQFTVGYEQVREALFGTFAVIFDPDDPEGTTRNIRNPDGIWIGPGSKPRNTRLSAVVFLSNPNATNLGRCKPIIFKNPWAVHSMNFDFLCADAFEVGDNEIIQTKKGKSLGELFGLSKKWPNS